jgi:5'(3')-deoxyribonucleotidase
MDDRLSISVEMDTVVDELLDMYKALLYENLLLKSALRAWEEKNHTLPADTTS